MVMEKAKVRFVQTALARMGRDPGPANGILEPRTLAALDGYPGLNPTWPAHRKVVGVIQDIARQQGIDSGKLDGYWGPQTEYAWDCLVEMEETGQPPRPWRPEELPRMEDEPWPVQRPQSELENFFGSPGEHLVQVELPYPHLLAWNTDRVIHEFTCHEKVRDSLVRVLSRVREYYGLEGINALGLDLWGGCYNRRKMRGGSRWSLYAWGIAVDYDPERNPLKWGRDRAVFARPEYLKWWEFWEAEGWVSLGRSRNFDWMHVQAARI